MLFGGGCPFPHDETSGFIFQKNLLKLQIAIEEAFTELGEASGRKCMMLFDRGLMDGKAYMSESQARHARVHARARRREPRERERERHGTQNPQQLKREVWSRVRQLARLTTTRLPARTLAVGAAARGAQADAGADARPPLRRHPPPGHGARHATRLQLAKRPPPLTTTPTPPLQMGGAPGRDMWGGARGGDGTAARASDDGATSNPACVRRAARIVSCAPARRARAICTWQAADGAEKFYTLTNNTVRTETPEQACSMDKKTLDCWTGHEHLYIVDNSTGFDEKMRRAMERIFKARRPPRDRGQA